MTDINSLNTQELVYNINHQKAEIARYVNKNVIPSKISIEECDFTVRTHNCLKRAGINNFR